MYPNGQAFLVALLEIIPFHHAGHRIFSRQLQNVDELQRLEPVTVKMHYGLARVQDFEHLLLIGVGIGHYLFLTQLPAGLRFATGIPDPAGVISDDQMYLMAQILELAHFIQDYRMPQVYIGSSWIQAQFYL